MSKVDTIQERMVEFAVQIIKLSSALPETPAGKYLADQLLRCGASPASIYGKAFASESAEDFANELGNVLKQLNELAIWLDITKRSEILSLEFVESLTSIVAENSDLTKTIRSSFHAVGDRKYS